MEERDLREKAGCKRCKHFLTAYDQEERYNEETDSVETVDVKILYCPLAICSFEENKG